MMNPFLSQTCYFANKMNNPAKLTRDDIILLNKDIRNSKYLFDSKR